MNVALNIVLFLLFISLHLNLKGMFVESQAVFYASVGITSLFILRKDNKKRVFNVNWGHIIVSLIFISLVIRFLIQGNPYGSYRVYTILICWFLFFIFSLLLHEDKRFLKLLFWIVVSTIIIEVVFGLGQLLGLFNNDNDLFGFGGSFGNPGAFAGFLSIISPLILSVSLSYKRNKKTENLYYLLLGCFIFTLYLLIISESRGAWLACLLGCIVVLYYKFSLSNKIKIILNTTLRKAIAIISLLIVVSVGSLLLYQYKADSAFGRTFIWKVTATMPHDNILFGNGIGHFEASYGKWQSAYFENIGGTESERYVADYVTCAYNEFLETFIEQGILVAVLLVLLFFFAFRSKNKANASIILGVKSSIVAILVLMCVSYPLKVTPVYLYLVFCFAAVFYQPHSVGQYTIAVGFWKKLIISLVGISITIGGLYNLYGYFLLRKGQQDIFSNQFEKGIETYKSASMLKNNGIYHFYYGSTLAQMKQYEMSIEELEVSILKSSNLNSYILLGNNYKEMKEFEKAEQAYLVAVNMVPSKLYSRYLMVKLYIEQGEFEKAERWAKDILNINEKVPTTAAKEIKAEMETFINSRKNSNP